MSGQTGDEQDRTEAPTARRLQKAEEEGEVPVSREAVLLAGLAAGTLTLLLMGPGIGRNLVRPLAVILSQPGLPASEPIALFHEIAAVFLGAIAPFVAPHRSWARLRRPWRKPGSRCGPSALQRRLRAAVATPGLEADFRVRQPG